MARGGRKSGGHRGHDVGHPDLAARPAAHSSRDGRRWPAAEVSEPLPSALQDTPRRNRSHRRSRRAVRGAVPARCARRPHLDRHPARLHGGLYWRAGAEKDAA